MSDGAGGCRLRPARPEDARPLASLHVRAWQQAYRGLVPDDFLAGLSVDRREALWRDEIRDEGADIIVAEDDDGAVGFVRLGACRDEDAGPETGEIFGIYIAPRAWRRGHGRRLCAAALARLRAAGFTAITLWVLRGNAQAIAFYEAMGFAADGVEKERRTRGGVVLPQVRYRLGPD
ncbi:MAG: GNAT family N-acetyltransferase [Candidatus Krumholzibacteriota bacterium]|nr:GNAT family N-acetyltransferase [Candidatus Krumholzibacteriota bacterium]